VPYRELLPHPALRPFVDRLWTRAGAGESAPLRVLPDGCIDVLVSLAEGRARAVGTMTRTLVIPPGRPLHAVAVRFRPGAAAPFLGIAAHALTDRQVDAGELGLRWLEAGALADGRDVDGAARALERALLARLRSVRPPDPLVAHAVRALFASAPPTVEALARRLGWSRQHLGRAFRAQVGVGPKQLARVARVQRALAGLQGARAPLAQVAADAGYFDEAHMDRDFRHLVGVTPRAARAAPGSIRPIPSLLEEA
jgi:AraC-like DNA-binding protein